MLSVLLLLPQQSMFSAVPSSCVCQIEGSGLDIVALVITELLRADLQVKGNR